MSFLLLKYKDPADSDGSRCVRSRDCVRSQTLCLIIPVNRGALHCF